MSHEEKTSEVLRFKLNMNNFVLSSVGDEAVLVPVSNSTANMGGVIELNGTAADILFALQADGAQGQGLTTQQLVDAISSKYEIDDMNKALASIQHFLLRLRDKGVIAVC